MADIVIDVRDIPADLLEFFEPVDDGQQKTTWTLGPSPFPDAHFATFPPEIPRRAILAGTSERGCCPRCGAPWRRQTTMTKSWREDAETAEQSYGPGSGNRRIRPSNGGMSTSTYETTGWTAGCACHAGPPVPCVCLDPFLGSGTTALVADRLGRDCIGIELNEVYAEMARKRIASDAPLLASVEVAR